MSSGSYAPLIVNSSYQNEWSDGWWTILWNEWSISMSAVYFLGPFKAVKLTAFGGYIDNFCAIAFPFLNGI